MRSPASAPGAADVIGDSISVVRHGMRWRWELLRVENGIVIVVWNGRKRWRHDRALEEAQNYRYAYLNPSVPIHPGRTKCR